MKKTIEIIVLVFILAGLTYLLTLLDINKFESVYDIAFTYLSITVGFVVTSITIIASSGFSKVLYGKPDPKNNSRTLLHSLLQQFQQTLIFYSIPMILILISSIISWQSMPCVVEKIFNSVLLILIVVTFPILIYQFRTMLKFIIQNVKHV